MTDDADPIVTAVADALLAEEPSTHPHSAVAFMEATDRARTAVTAYRRAVLDQRDDGERWAQVRSMLWSPSAAVWVSEQVPALLAALADAEIARRQAEADRDVLIQVRDEAVGKTADYAELSAILAAERDRLMASATGCAEEIGRVRTKAAALMDGELAHRSRDYGRGVAQATRDILAALDG